MISIVGMAGHRRPARRSRRLAAALAAALAGGLLAAAPAGASAHATAAGGSFGGFLNDVSCVSAADCWALGQNSAGHAVADHWNGSAWTVAVVAGPPGARFTYLPSVSCVSGTDCWAVGQYQAHTGRQLAYAEHWNGTAWSPVAVPVRSTLFSILISVSCASAASCQAVGAQAPGLLLERWNGHAWSAMPGPGLGQGANPERVSCVSAADCWLSGMHGTSKTGGTLIGHWAGTAWTAVSTPTSHIPADGLLGISCQAAACMTVGDRANTRPLALRWNGSSWAVTRTGTVAAVFYAVACTTPLNCMAVGGTSAGNGQVFSERWSGSRWRAVPAQAPRGAVNSSLVGVACVSAADCWGTGSYYNGTTDRSLIEHWNGTSWSVTVR